MKSRFWGWTSTKELNSNNNNQDHKKEDLPEQGSRISEVLQDLCYSGRQARNQSWMWWKRCDHCPWLSPALAAQSYLVQASCCHLPSISTQKLTSLNQVIERKKQIVCSTISSKNMSENYSSSSYKLRKESNTPQNDLTLKAHAKELPGGRAYTHREPWLKRKKRTKGRSHKTYLAIRDDATTLAKRSLGEENLLPDHGVVLVVGVIGVP